MSYIKKIILFLAILFASLIITTSVSNATTIRTATNDETLRTALDAAVSGDVVEITENISLKKPIGITDKNITIDAKGHSITKADDWTNSGNDGSFISVGAGAKVTLTNITLQNSEKYGVQAYNGGYVILNGVRINNCGFGAVLVNAGTVEVRDLTLGRNGNPNNNGIEIAKGSTTDAENVPTVVMNGKLTSTETENVVYVAENNPTLKNFEVKNEEGTEDKILISGNTVVITDKQGKVLYKSNDIGDVEVAGEKYTAPKNEDPKKDETPKTGTEDNLLLSVTLMTALVFAVVTIAKRED